MEVINGVVVGVPSRGGEPAPSVDMFEFEKLFE
jgi:hypothetical protein